MKIRNSKQRLTIVLGRY